MASESRASSLPRIRSADTRSGFARSAWVWLGLVAFLAIVDLFIVFVGAGLENDPRATLFSWPAIAVVGVVGLAGMWLAGFALRGRGREMIFWILAVLTSVIEPASQDLPSLRAGTELAVALNFAPDYVLNFVQAVLFRRSGFLSAIIVRVAFYLGWH